MGASRILGIDPGTNILGFAVIEVERDQVRVLEIGVIHLKEKKDQNEKLRDIFLEVQEIIERYLPQDLAIEAPFFWQECAIDAEAWARTRCSNGSRNDDGPNDHRIFSKKK